jgi:acetylornithine deacetylase
MSALAPSAKAILGHIVGFDTTSHKTNLPMADWVRDYLQQHGIDCRLIPSADGVHASLFATIGPEGVPGIGLSGHMDVVPVIGQSWNTDPFDMIEREGKLYGRGTSDMKGYLACVLAAVAEFKQRKLKIPLHIIFSYDEEIGCTGVLPMIAEFGKSLPKPWIVLVGEPTTMTVVDAHKGGYRFRTEIVGKDAHSSKPQLGVNAIMIAAELISELKRIEQRLKAHQAPRFDPPFSSISVSTIEGGIAHNIIPPKCAFYWGVRALPGQDAMSLAAELDLFAARELLPAMWSVSPECSIVTRLLGVLPAFTSGEQSEATSLAMSLAEQNTTFAVPYATEASHFQAAGCSAAVCGPGDIAQAHQPNEFIAVAELDKCMTFLRRLADWLERCA